MSVPRSMSVSVRRVGIVGFGSLGQYLAKAIDAHPELELVFVWNRTLNDTLKSVLKEGVILDDLDNFKERNPDLIVEVAHPVITKDYGKKFVSFCDYMIGSPTALSDLSLLDELERISVESGHAVYVPSGALWGGEDIKKMADRGTLHALTITMKKHPRSFKLEGKLKELNEEAFNKEEETILYEGCVRDLCPLAPNNVNTMAAAAIAAHNLGFGEVTGRLISDPRLIDWHIIEIHLEGPMVNGHRFFLETIRKNPADPGAITGSATYASFLSSLLQARNKGTGLHLC